MLLSVAVFSPLWEWHRTCAFGILWRCGAYDSKFTVVETPEQAQALYSKYGAKK